MSPSIIFENEHFLIINKPSGMVVHPFDFSDEVTLLDFLYKHNPEIFVMENPVTLQDNRTINLGGIVHKLDRDTSGALVVAKTKEVFEELRDLFTTKQIQKTYVALVDGVIKEDTLHIDAPLGRNKKDYKQVAYPKNPRGDLREALTDLHVIKRNEITTLIELQPRTGRTHQLRAHMAYISHPIVGDIAYGSTLSSAHIMLHAEKIAFSLFKEEYTFEIKNNFDEKDM